jgi:hypothetical protein
MASTDHRRYLLVKADHALVDKRLPLFLTSAKNTKVGDGGGERHITQQGV